MSLPPSYHDQVTHRSDIAHGARAGQRCPKSSAQNGHNFVKARFRAFLTNLFLGRQGCACCTCFRRPDDTIPFWTHEDTEINSTTIHDDYSETFETAHTERSAGAQTSQSQTTRSRAPSRRLANGRPHVSPNNNNIRKTSESESEDSFSVQPSEISDASEVENRIRNLKAELEQRKLEAERLKRQSEQQRKQKLKQQEEQLKQQIESYDRYIDQYKTDMTRSPDHSEHITRPHIMPPSSKSAAKVLVPGGDRAGSVDRHRVDTDTRSGELSSPRKPPEVPQRAKDKSSNRRTLSKAQPPPPPEVKSESSAVRTEVSEAISGSKKDDKSEPLLKLQLEDKAPAAEDKERLPAVTPSSARDSRLDSMRSVSEIPEDITQPSQTPRTDSELSSPPLDDKVTHTSPEESTSRQTVQSKSEMVTTQRSVHTEEGTTPRDGLSETAEPSSVHSRSETSHVSSYSEDYTSDVSTRTSEQSYQTSYTSTSTRKATDSERSEKTEGKKVATPEEISSETINEESVPDDLSQSSGVMLQINIAEQSLKDHLEDYDIGERVLVPDDKIGTLRFKGFVKFAPGLHAGVELDSKDGENNGSVDLTEYFRCPPGHGVFVLGEMLSKLTPEHEETLKKAKEIEQIISQASEAVESFIKDQTKTKDSDGDEESIKDVPDLDFEEEKLPEELAIQSEEGKAQDHAAEMTNKSEMAAENTMKKMVDDALTKMINIRKQKRASLEPATTEETPDDERDSTRTKSEDIHREDPEREHQEKGQSSAVVEDLQNPMTSLEDFPDLSLSQEPQFLVDDDDPYNFDTDDPWNDDDLYLPSSTSKDEPGGVDKEELRLDLSKLTEERQEPVRSYIPNSRDEACKIVEQIIDFYWERRRYGESWTGVEFPASSMLDSEEMGSDVVAMSRRSHKHMLFELTGDFLRDLYKDEDKETETQPIWVKQRLPKRRYHKHLSPPTTVDSLKPIVTRHVLGVLRLDGDSKQSAPRKKWSMRKKMDRVDEILLEELQAEEPFWVNYDQDELKVKNRVTDEIFEAYVLERGTPVAKAFIKRSR